MAGKMFIDDDGDICIEGRENNLVALPARDDRDEEWPVLNPDVVQEIVRRWNAHDDLVAEIARLTSEVTQLRADLANAGAVMVEACARACDRIDDQCGMEAGLAASCAETVRALSTLSPIAAAARVLIPVFEEKHRAYMTAKGRNPDDYGSSYSMAVQDLRALAEQEKADG